jgi:hypothetical protein
MNERIFLGDVGEPTNGAVVLVRSDEDIEQLSQAALHFDQDRPGEVLGTGCVIEDVLQGNPK